MKRQLMVTIAICLSLSWALPAQTPFAATPQVSTKSGLLFPHELMDSYTPFQDVRFKEFKESVQLTQHQMASLTFNRLTEWNPQAKALSEKVLALGLRPGLGVGALHAKGITGKGVSVAIIDQNLAGEHPEFKGKMAKYFDMGCKQGSDEGSMHGPAVASLLVGTNNGTAPDANLYFYAAPSWLGDAVYYARALEMIIQLNNQLKPENRIRVVSVSAAPSGNGSPFKLNNQQWDKAMMAAEAANLLVLDCTTQYGFVAPGYYDPIDPDNRDGFMAGWPNDPKQPQARAGVVFAPTSYRTVAEEYRRGEPSYQYTGMGGLSWGIPYAAGVAALAWQVNPAITAKQMKSLLIETALPNKHQVTVINPEGLVKAARDLQPLAKP